MASRYRSYAIARRADTSRAIAMVTGGVAVFAPIEAVLATIFYSGPIDAGSLARYVPIVFTLSLWLWLILRILLARTMRTMRWLRGQIDPAALTAEGWFVAGTLDEGVRPNVPLLWALLATTGVYGAIVAKIALWADHYKEPQLRAMVIAALAVGAVVIARETLPYFQVATRTAARVLAPILRGANPLGRWRAAGITFAAGTAGALVALATLFPQSRADLPVRNVVSVVTLAFGMGLGAYWHAHAKPRVRSRGRGIALALASFAIMMMTLLR